MPKRRGAKRSELERLRMDLGNLPLRTSKRSNVEPSSSTGSAATGRTTSDPTPSAKRTKEEVPDEGACKVKDDRKQEPGSWKHLIRPCPYDIDSCPFLHGTIKMEQNARSDTELVEELSVADWTAHDVSRWAFAVTKSVKAAERFIENDVDGEALLLLNRTTMLKELGLKLGPAVKLYKRAREAEVHSF